MRIIIIGILLLLSSCKTERATVTAIDGRDGVNATTEINNNFIQVLIVNQCVQLVNDVYAQNEGNHVNIYDNRWCLDSGRYYSICTDLYNGDICECGDHYFRVDWEGLKVWIE